MRALQEGPGFLYACPLWTPSLPFANPETRCQHKDSVITIIMRSEPWDRAHLGVTACLHLWTPQWQTWKVGGPHSVQKVWPKRPPWGGSLRCLWQSPGNKPTVCSSLGSRAQQVPARQHRRPGETEGAQAAGTPVRVCICVSVWWAGAVSQYDENSRRSHYRPGRDEKGKSLSSSSSRFDGCCGGTNRTSPAVGEPRGPGLGPHHYLLVPDALAAARGWVTDFSNYLLNPRKGPCWLLWVLHLQQPVTAGRMRKTTFRTRLLSVFQGNI